MSQPITIKDFLNEEKNHRNQNVWWFFDGNVIADNGVEVHVQIKSSGFYNQILRFDNDPTNYCLGHTCSKVSEMKQQLTNKINKAAGAV